MARTQVDEAGVERASAAATADARLFGGAGEMRACCRALDWGATPLGPVEAWPQSLRTAAALVLAAPTPMILLWGPELVQLYNDGYAAIMGAKHPAGLGQRNVECWPEVWEFTAPIYTGVRERAEAFTFTDQRLVLERHGRPEETFFSLTYSPVFDEAGGVGGIFVTVVETTDRVRARGEREAALEATNRRLADSEARYRALFEALDAGFCVIEVLFDTEGRAADYRFLETNPAFVGQTGLVDAVGRTARELVPDLEPHWFDLYGRVARTGEPTRFESGSEAMGRWFDVFAFRIDRPEDRRVAVFFHDVSATKAAERERERLLSESERARAEAEAARAEAERAARQLQDQAVELELQAEELQATAAQLEERTEEAEAERARLDRVVTQFPAAVAIYEGPELRVRAVSDAYRRMVGGRDIVGHPIRLALPELSGGADRADSIDFFALLEGVRRTGEPAVGTAVPAVWDDNGDGIAEAHVVDFVYTPLSGRRDRRGDGASDISERPDGAVADGVVAMVLDVSARARAETAVRESEARFREMADAAPVMLWVTEADGRCTLLNRAWLDFTGQTLDEGLGFGWLDAVHPADAAEAERVFLDATSRKAPFRLEYRLRRHDGEYRRALDAAAPRLGLGDEFFGYVGSVVDIEERARLLDAERVARAEAEAANQAKSQFLTTMSHELRTPLNAIAGYAELLTLGVRGPVTEAQRQDLERLRLANQHMAGLVTDVLNFARIEAGQVEYHPEAVPIAALVQDLEALVGPQLAAKGIACDHNGCGPETPDRPHAVWADPEKVRQILLNLLVNASKFTDRGGRVALACETDRAAGVVRVRVTDTGRGIAGDQLARVFEPFVQVDRHRTHESQQGVGLGLAISRDLARGMGGDLTAESTLGEGSTFTLTLPAAVDPA